MRFALFSFVVFAAIAFSMSDEGPLEKPGETLDDAKDGERFVQELRDHVAHEIGPIAKPREIILTPELPKTRSGKIMRRLLRDVSEHRELGDVTTLMDPTVVNAIKEGMASGAEDKE